MSECVPCGRGGNVQDIPRLATTEPTSRGGYELKLYPDCTVMYQGKWEGGTIYVVGRGTDDERMFKFTQLAEASSYSNAVRLQIEGLPTAGLCLQAVEDTLG